MTPDVVAHFRSAGAYLDVCIHDYLAEAARRFPARPAVSDAVWNLTFAELAEATQRTASALAEAGIGPRSVVGVQSANYVEFLIGHFALATVGAVTLTLPASLSPGDTAKLLVHADADGVVIEDVRAADLERRLAAPLPVWAYSRKDADGPLVSAFEGTGMDVEPARDPDADFIMMPTSGSTGLPKLAVRTHNAWLAMARKKLAVVSSLELAEVDSVLVLSPINQGQGYLQGFLLPLLLPGMRRMLLTRFDPEEALRLIERERPTVLVGVPAQAIKILQHPAFPDFDLSSLKVLMTGGDAFPADFRAQFEERTGAPVILAYGASDVGAACAPGPDDSEEKRRGTSGRPLRWTEVRIRSEDGRPLEAGEVGEIWIRGPDLISGYYPVDDPPTVEGGGFPTGDLGFFDDDGYLVVSGRSKDIIIRGGLNISPGEVETAVRLHPLIADAAAIGMPDPVFGERICVFAIAAASPAPTLEDVVALLAEARVAKTMWPERLVFISDFPVSAGGKVQKAVLRQWLENEGDPACDPTATRGSGRSTESEVRKWTSS